MDQRDETLVLERGEERIDLRGRLDAELALRSPVAVRLWREADEYVADAPDLNLYAFGTTKDEAIAHLRVQIAEQHRRLEELGNRLAPPARVVADRLRAVVQRHDG